MLVVTVHGRVLETSVMVQIFIPQLEIMFVLNLHFFFIFLWLRRFSFMAALAYPSTSKLDSICLLGALLAF